MKILFIGESWLGSCARSLKEALARRSDIELDEISEDAWFPKPRARWLRAINRLTAPAYRRELNALVLAKVADVRPDIVLTYKGYPIRTDLLAAIRDSGALSVNVYPDYSPHAYGAAHRAAVGDYDLVVSTKSYHPALWREVYGYRNRCLFVPQGYDPALHLVPEPPRQFDFDVVLVATYRAEYGRLMSEFAAALNDTGIKGAIGGYGWEGARIALPLNWVLLGPVQGRNYVSTLRRGKICIAPLTREVVINGQRQPGDVDTTRSYELAAAHCFFIHRRTDFAMELYGPDEVPMFDDGAELAQHVRHYLTNESERVRSAARSHARAVPAYSVDSRAALLAQILKDELRDGARASRA
jgi:spore maturation protein CgeB